MNDPVQLQAWVPEQLLLRFNEQAPHGKRNAHVKAALERYLAERKRRLRPVAAATAAITQIDEISDEREAIELMRSHAAAILQIASRVAELRKGPKAASSRRKTAARKVGER
jgi:hypothetical protein